METMDEAHAKKKAYDMLHLKYKKNVIKDYKCPSLISPTYICPQSKLHLFCGSSKHIAQLSSMFYTIGHQTY